jgi:hypothetical protein
MNNFQWLDGVVWKVVYDEQLSKTQEGRDTRWRYKVKQTQKEDGERNKLNKNEAGEG